MKLASYIGTRSGIMGVGNILIRWRTGGKESHSEVMFEPGDGVDHLMPDGTCAPDANGALWHFSSVGLERMPEFSPRRPGALGGARFKRIVPDESKWNYLSPRLEPLPVAQRALILQGALYDWQVILMFLFWLIPNKLSRGMCSETVALLFGVPPEEAFLLSPRILRITTERFLC